MPTDREAVPDQAPMAHVRVHLGHALTYPEISSLTGIDYSQVQKIERRALRKMRAAMLLTMTPREAAERLRGE